MRIRGTQVKALFAAAMVAMTMTGCEIYFGPPDDAPDEPIPPPDPDRPVPDEPVPDQPPPPEEPVPDRPTPDDPVSEWSAYDFVVSGRTPACEGPRFIHYAAAYDRWIGAIQCGSATRYKLYMSEGKDSVYFEIADFAGHGQDHCELVNPAFKIIDDDDITSGGCTTCAVGELVDLIDVRVYARGYFGEPFELVAAEFWADLGTEWYECGVAIPGAL